MSCSILISSDNILTVSCGVFVLSLFLYLILFNYVYYDDILSDCSLVMRYKWPLYHFTFINKSVLKIYEGDPKICELGNLG